MRRASSCPRRSACRRAPQAIVARRPVQAIGAVLAALISGVAWFIRDLPGILSAPRTGTIRSKAYGAPLIRREDDPGRFERLVAYRRKQLIWPTLMLLFAFGYFPVMIGLRIALTGGLE